MGLGERRRLLKIHTHPPPQEQRTALKIKRIDCLKSQSQRDSAPPQYHWDAWVLELSVSPRTAGTQLCLPSLGHNIETVSFTGKDSPQPLLFVPEKQNIESSSHQALTVRDTKHPLQSWGLGSEPESPRPCCTLPHRPRVEGTKGRVPWNDYSNFLVKSLFLSDATHSG